MAKNGTSPHKILSVDDQLTDHLKNAEHHLIAAVKLFERKNKPVRAPHYVQRLTRAQENVTWLLREELIRMRGPIKIAAIAIKRKKK